MKKWKVINSSTPSLGEKSSGFSTEKIVDLLLKNRGIKTKKEVDEFLNPRLESVSIAFSGIDGKEVLKTIKRIEKAIEKKEKIIIYGDYDVDGICGTAILWETIYAFYENTLPYIPHRVDEGYGLSIRGIENLLSQNKDIGLIITVDNGIVASEAVEFANKNGIDVIITDHHVAPKSKKSELPKAYAIVHTTKLCGTGVAYLLSQEVFRSRYKVSSIKGDKKPLNTEYSILNTNFLELVALATVADVVPLVGDNRTLLKVGLDSLRKTKRLGLLALFDEAKIKKEEIDVYHIGHIIAPRLNAAGRMDHAIDGLRLICTMDKKRAEALAKKLSETNRDRQVLTEEMRLHAESISDKIEVSKKIIFVHDEAYNQGVIGLVASRLVEKHYRPAFVVSIGETLSKGSARSIRGFNIIEFIRSFEEYLVNAGGHPMAAGFTIETSKVAIFKKALEEKSKEFLTEEILTRILEIDMELGFDSINLDLFSAMQALSPFGQGNPEPIFATKKVQVINVAKVGKEGNHLKLMLERDGKRFSAMWFGNGTASSLISGNIVDLAYTIDLNIWRDKKELILKVRDIQTN